MQRTLKLLLVAGARPNFMKIAPLIKAIQSHNQKVEAGSQGAEVRGQQPEVGIQKSEIDNPQSSIINHKSESPSQPSTINSQLVRLCYKLLHTGQHYDAKMSDVFFRELGIPEPDFNLGVGSGSHAAQTAAIMTAFEPILLNAFATPPSDSHSQLSTLNSQLSSTLRPPPSDSVTQPSTLNSQLSPLPDWLIVVGDVNSTMACTLVASKLGVKVAHVEAGLRSFDRTMPEEINRLVTDALADLLLTPSEDANENLRREGVAGEKIKLVGNIMIDSLIENLPQARQSTVLERLGLPPGRFAYVTLHRPSNVDHRDSLGRIVRELERLAATLPVVLPIHPRTKKMMQDFGLTWNGTPNLRVVEPLGYHDSLCLTENARLVLTDSGGLQEESTYFRTPCLTLRPNTERPVTIQVGSNRLTHLARLGEDLRDVLTRERRLGRIPPLWDGLTSERILSALLPPDSLQ